MKGARALLVGLALLAGCASDPEQASAPASPAPESAGPPEPLQGEFDVLTYNVAGLPGPVARTDPERCMPLISPKLAPYDLVLVQEDFVYHQELRAQVPHAFLSEPGDNAGALVNDGLNRYSSFAFDALERVRWVECHGFRDHASDCLATKGFSRAAHELAPGVSVQVYNHHAEAGGSDADEAAWEAGFRQLAEHILGLGEDVPLLVAGDMNLHGDQALDLAVLDELYARTGLRDACSELGCSDPRRIDRVLLRSSSRVRLEPLAWWLPPDFVDEQGGRLSDHRAVAVRVRWTLLPDRG